MLLVDAAHQGGGGWQNLIDEDEDSLLRRELNSLANNIDELANGEICGNQVLLLVDRSNVALLNLLADDLYESSQPGILGVGGWEQHKKATRPKAVTPRSIGLGRPASSHSIEINTRKSITFQTIERKNCEEKNRRKLLTGMRSEYFWRMRSASALRFSKGCSSLNLLRIMTVADKSGSDARYGSRRNVVVDDSESRDSWRGDGVQMKKTRMEMGLGCDRYASGRRSAWTARAGHTEERSARRRSIITGW